MVSCSQQISGNDPSPLLSTDKATPQLLPGTRETVERVQQRARKMMRELEHLLYVERLTEL